MKRTVTTRPEKQEENAAMMKSKMKDLEDEVQHLKQRLADLRKAKSNTIVKREREVIQVGQPNMGRPVGVETSKYAELQRKLSSSEQKRSESEKELGCVKTKLQEGEKKLENKIEELNQWKFKYQELENEFATWKRTHDLEIEKIRANAREKGAAADEYGNELERLRERLEVKAMQEEHKKRENSDREGHITDLTAENASLRDRVDALLLELSIKEANWLENEERMKKRMTEQWDERYAQWIQDTEKKIEELKAANLLLRGYLKKSEGKTLSSPNGESNAGPSKEG